MVTQRQSLEFDPRRIEIFNFFLGLKLERVVGQSLIASFCYTILKIKSVDYTSQGNHTGNYSKRSTIYLKIKDSSTVNLLSVVDSDASD